MFNDEDFLCTGVPTDTVLNWLQNNELNKFLAIIADCNYSQNDWIIALEISLAETISDLGHELEEYHVCNNDAIMQVDLVKNYIATGDIELIEGDCNGPMWYYTPD